VSNFQPGLLGGLHQRISIARRTHRNELTNQDLEGKARGKLQAAAA